MTAPQYTELDVLLCARDLADRAVIADIETEGIATTDEQGTRWYDVRHLLDPREQPSECIDMFSQAVSYALARGLISVSSAAPHLLRINPLVLAS